MTDFHGDQDFKKKKKKKKNHSKMAVVFLGCFWAYVGQPFGFFFWKNFFFCFIPMKISHKLCDRMDGTQFWCFSWFPTNSLLCVILHYTVYVYNGHPCWKLNLSLRWQIAKSCGSLKILLTETKSWSTCILSMYCNN